MGLQATYLKAEAMFTKGEIEKSLVLYHRGLRMRPNSEEFRSGIAKAQIALQDMMQGNYKCHYQQVYFYHYLSPFLHTLPAPKVRASFYQTSED